MIEQAAAEASRQDAPVPRGRGHCDPAGPASNQRDVDHHNNNDNGNGTCAYPLRMTV